MEDDEEIEYRVPHDKLERVRTSEKLRPFLGHSKLRKVIREIMGSRNRNKRLWQ